ncbi:MAG TPA: phosphoadenylyl-sulfate reductase [Abditibacteriaceae bacterium]|jgi:phosphoadenosine phosphosulfate reductase
MKSFPPFDELDAISQTFEAQSPQDILAWAMQTYGEKLTMATAFGAEGCALLAMIARLRDERGLTVPDVFNLDTGYQFEETLELKRRIEAKYNLLIRFARAEETVEEWEARNNGPVYTHDPAACCHARKVVPLGNAVQGFAAWITAIRRDQTPERAGQPIIGPETKFEMVKINPLANWTKAQVWEFVKENDVPTNPLHDQGFPSIGCWPCTRAVAEGEDDRAGRWSNFDKRECGLHLGPDGKLTRIEPSGPQPIKMF